MNTPKYVGIVQSDPQWPQLIAHGDDKAQVESDINKDVSQLKGRIGDIYIRERDTRRQFSPSDLKRINKAVEESGVAFLWDPSGSTIKVVADIVLTEFRKLINQP
jgi:hypothetical protein